MMKQLQVGLIGTPISARSVRKQLRNTLDRWGIEFNIAYEELLIAVGEAVSNAFRHGCDSKPMPIRVCVDYCPAFRLIKVDVYDLGKGFDTSIPFRAEPIEDIFCCGRFLMGKCVDQVAYEQREKWFCCSLVKKL